MKNYIVSNRPQMTKANSSGAIEVSQKQRIQPRIKAANSSVRVVKAANTKTKTVKGNWRKENVMR